MTTSTDLKTFKIAKGTKAQIITAYNNGDIGGTDFAIATDEDYVDSVNGQTGAVVLTASDVGALPDSTVIPTEATVSGWGFTKNVGTVTSVNNVAPVNGNVSLSIPTVYDSTISFTQGGVSKGSFTLNQASGATIDLDVGGGGGSLPPQTGHAGEFLTTDGTDASWAKTPTGRNVGELVYSAMPLTDAGLHLLDGTLLSGGGIYEEFVQYVAGLVSSYPSLFTSESTWQSTVSSKGVCGKFVYTQGRQWYKWYCAQYDHYFYTESLSPQQYDPIYYYNDASNWVFAFYVKSFQEGAEYDTIYNDNNVSMTRAHGDTTIDLDIPSTIRLPKYSNKIYTSDIVATTSVVGNGKGLVLTNGSVEMGIQSDCDSSYCAWGKSSTNVGGAIGSSANRDGGTYASIFGVSTDATKSGLIANLSNITTSLEGYYYIVVANSVKTAIEVDIDQIVTDLNGKADVDLTNLSNGLANTICTTKPSTSSTASSAKPAVVVQNYRSGSNWYRVYSDGWIEQGGVWSGVNVNTTASRNLLKAFTNTNYTCILQPNTSSFQNTGIHYVVSKTTSTTTISGYGTSSANLMWYACGY